MKFIMILFFIFLVCFVFICKFFLFELFLIFELCVIKIKLFFMLLFVMFIIGIDNVLLGIGLGFDLVSLCLIELKMDVFLLFIGEEFLFFLLFFLLFVSDGFFGIGDVVGDEFRVFLGEFGMGFL